MQKWWKTRKKNVFAQILFFCRKSSENSNLPIFLLEKWILSLVWRALVLFMHIIIQKGRVSDYPQLRAYHYTHRAFIHSFKFPHQKLNPAEQKTSDFFVFLLFLTCEICGILRVRQFSYNQVGTNYRVPFTTAQFVCTGEKRRIEDYRITSKTAQCLRCGSNFSFDYNPFWGGPIPEVVQYRANPWPGRSKPLFHGLGSKISLIYKRLYESRFRY